MGLTIKDNLINKFTLQLNSQCEKGFNKYGHSLDDCPPESYDWRSMLIEEMIDALQYQEKEIQRLQSLLKR